MVTPTSDIGKNKWARPKFAKNLTSLAQRARTNKKKYLFFQMNALNVFSTNMTYEILYYETCKNNPVCHLRLISFPYNLLVNTTTFLYQETLTKKDSPSIYLLVNTTTIVSFLFENVNPFYRHFPFNNNTTTHIIELRIPHSTILFISKATAIV